ncbi:glycosyltransferase family 2 protein [Candidatus Vampirococcus lugosii]|uniref:Glycosyl transferase family 2 n=1 Tax=Candidatus Vampirococcus lugosii TaxID=2789015 RepID=A0ABS5QL68_9BACT|nr:glycosyltransferase family 2 protein [Candidatus Vampirococcus lugosii]MBS8121931.1 glycosyl transferase family 2 [Candidatus Vampirococcus lugosii]
MAKKIISIVIPFYNEEGNIIPLYKEISSSLLKDFVNFDYEIIMINDGSNDNTWQEIQEVKKLDSNIVGINLNRNYGQSIAMDAGLQKVNGEIIATIDGDGQNDPQDIKKLYDKMIDENLDLVAGWRNKRKDPTWMLVITKTARFLRRIMINDGVHDSGCTLRIYKKTVINNLYLWAEMHRYIIAISKMNGFKIGELKVNHRARTIGTSKYNWKKSIKGLIDLFYIWFVAKYESRPLHLFGFVGGINFVIGNIFLFYSIYQKIFDGISLNRSGWLILGIFLIQIGVIIFIFGIIIDLMIRNYYNTSRDKRYIIREEV